MEIRKEFVYKNKETVFDVKNKDGVLYLEYPIFQALNMVKHGFSTRIGGVSKGVYDSLNLSYTRGDRNEDVTTNFMRMGNALGISVDRMVCSKQTHTTNVKVVGEQDAGSGTIKEIAYNDVDGMITNVPNLCLATFYADCVPLYFVDPVKRAIGLSHSGWRGTAGKIGRVTIEKMKAEYGSNPNDIIAAIGPSICQDCYEVSEEVVQIFKEQFESKYWEELFYRKNNGKYQLNLWKANELILLDSGIPKSQIVTTNLCTSCNHELLFSHRVTQGQRGNLGAFLSLL